jgi:hypothetical protein
MTSQVQPRRDEFWRPTIKSFMDFYSVLLANWIEAKTLYSNVAQRVDGNIFL